MFRSLLLLSPLSALHLELSRDENPKTLNAALQSIKAAEAKAKADDEKMDAQLDRLNQQLSHFRAATSEQEEKTRKEQAKIKETIEKIRNFSKQHSSSSFAQTSQLLSESMKDFARRTREDAENFGKKLRREVAYKPLLEKVEGMVPSGEEAREFGASFLEVASKTEEKAPTISVDVKAIRSQLDAAFKNGYNKSLKHESPSLASLRKGRTSSFELQPEQFPIHNFASNDVIPGWTPSSFLSLKNDDDAVDAHGALEQAAEQVNLAHAESVARGQNLGLDSDGNIIAPVSPGVNVDVTSGEGGPHFSQTSFLETDNGSAVKKSLEEASAKLKEVEEDMEAHQPSIVFPPLEKKIKSYMQQAEDAVKGLKFEAHVDAEEKH